MILQEMVVTNAEGKVKTAKGENLTGQCIHGEDVYTFYAIKKVNDPALTPKPDQMASKIKIMMPLGGDLNGMYRFPRVGEKVVVGVEGSAHYLMGYLPTQENPFSPEKEKTDAFDKEAQVMRYKKTGQNTSDSTYSEIGFYSETTEWKEKEGSSNKKLENGTDLPIIDKIKLSSTGDIESHAQNYNETSAKRIALFAGYGDDIEKRKAKQKENLKAKKIKEEQLRAEGKDPDKEDKDPLDLGAFPVLPQDYTDQEPGFFSGDIHMRAKRRIVLKAEDTIDIIAGNSMIRLDSSGISLISKKSSISAVNPWDSVITVSSREGLSMFGTKVNINSAYKFSLSDAFGGNVFSLGGVMRITGPDIRLRTMCKAAYVVKGVSAGVSFATNVASSIQGIVQEAKGGTHEDWLDNGLPSYTSIGANVISALVGANWGFNSMPAIDDPAGDMATVTDVIITLLGVANLALDKLFLAENDKKSGGRAGLTLAAMTVEYGLILKMFIALNVATVEWFHASSYLMKFGGSIYEDAMHTSHVQFAKSDAEGPTAGVDTTMVGNLWSSFSAQAWWKIVLESIAAAGVVAGGITGTVMSKTKRYNVIRDNVRKELEEL